MTLFRFKITDKRYLLGRNKVTNKTKVETICRIRHYLVITGNECKAN